MNEPNRPEQVTAEPPIVVTVAGQSFWSRLFGNVVGNVVVGIIGAAFRYSMWIWVPVALGSVMSLFGWEVKPPQAFKDKAHNVVEGLEKFSEKTSDKLKGVRESMELAKVKAELEIERVKAKTSEEKEELARKISELELRRQQEKNELERKFKEEKEKAKEEAAEQAERLHKKKNELALNVAGKVVENRVDAAKDSLISSFMPWGKSVPAEPEPPRDPNATMVRLAGGKFKVPNARCEFCSALLVIGELKRKELKLKDLPAVPQFAPVVKYGLEIVRIKAASELPTEGKNLVVVGSVDSVFHFRIFDGNGRKVVDVDQKHLPNDIGFGSRGYGVIYNLRNEESRRAAEVYRAAHATVKAYQSVRPFPEYKRDSIIRDVAWIVDYEIDLDGTKARKEWESTAVQRQLDNGELRAAVERENAALISENARLPVTCPNCRETISAVGAKQSYEVAQEMRTLNSANPSMTAYPVRRQSPGRPPLIRIQ